MATTNWHEQSETDAGDEMRTSLSLIGRAKQNDPEAWERLVKLHAPLVYYWCKESGLPEPDLHDVFQEVFHTLACKIGKFRPIENGTFRGWLRTMTRNKLTDHLRRSDRDPRGVGGTDALRFLEQFPATANRLAATNSGEVDMVEEVSSDPVSSEAEIQHSMLCQALANIRPNYSEQTWKAFWMVVIDGRQTIDVALDLGMNPGTVRVAKCRILKRLRLEIGDSI